MVSSLSLSLLVLGKVFVDLEAGMQWGYNGGSEGAVMTVVNREKKRVAWFGWGDVTSKGSFPDVGPYAVSTL